MRRIWGRKSSINVMKVLWACEELGLPYERIDVGGAFGGTRTPEYLAMNPNSLIPTLQEDNFTLWESNAIVRYLGHAYGAKGGLWPQDPRARADIDRWMDWQVSTIGESMRICFWTLIRTPPEKRDMAAVAKAREDLLPKWARLDAHMANRAYIGGPAFTLGDIPLGCYAHRWLSLPLDRPAVPNIEAWYGRLKERPGYAKWVAVPLE
ncbi:MAG: glutathione S-transferase [Alphaproteobacteria bacterium]|nr:glutathione S-transferase [Alphaproteobacteria bacterium]